MNDRLRKLALPIIAALLATAYFITPIVARPNTGPDTDAFGELPASHAGRYLPLDSIARTALLSISGRQTVRSGGDRLDATTWFLELIARPDAASELEIFRVDHPELRATLALSNDSQRRFSFSQVMQGREELQRQVQLTQMVPSEDRSLFQRRVMQLSDQVTLYQTLGSMLDVHPIPSAQPGQEWMTLSMRQSSAPNAAQKAIAAGYAAAFEAYQSHDIRGFNRVVADLRAAVAAESPPIARRAADEARFNRANVFQRSIVLYLTVSLMLAVSWLRWRPPLMSAATAILLVVWTAHTIGIIARIYLSGRPPVTNLYSSALFIGWGMALLGLGVEYFYRSGSGLFVGAVSGFLTLMVARGLSSSGDTMAVLQAVLDTNFWLATHVIVITLGYAATYLAGLLGALFIIRGTATKSLSPQESKRLAQMIYGIVCFATLFSFVGTILGGIWADQSWGRFWGWDPKENGALIIVLWNALILHARWGGMARARGIAVLAVAGNIITSWSWFGVNMLGRGLHSYGFIDSAAFWLIVFVATQLALIALGSWPLRLWRSGPQPT